MTRSTEYQKALIELMDDTSPSVQRALLAEFQRQGGLATHFLQELANGTNRILAYYAHWFLSELKCFDPVAEFRGFIRSLSFELETGVFLISRIVSRELDIVTFSEQLDALAARCRELITEPANSREKCRVINRVLFSDYGFIVEREQLCEPKHDYIEQVLARRKGTLASVCVIYLLVAHRVGLHVEPLVLPNDFVVGCYTDIEPFFLDVAEQGNLKTSYGINVALRNRHSTRMTGRLAPSPTREVLGRCCQNLSAHYNVAGQKAHAQLFGDFAAELNNGLPGCQI